MNKFKSESGKRFRALCPLLLTVCVVIVAYTGIYCFLSANGQYQPEVVGASGIKSYAWAPAGFYNARDPWPGSALARAAATNSFGGWKASATRIFYPLWRIDNRFIHKATWPDNQEFKQESGDQDSRPDKKAGSQHSTNE
jgi:hypothetical protein